MSEQQQLSSDLESRLAALEASVARLSQIVEPAFLVSRIAAPIAGPILKERAQHAYSAKFFALLDAGESLIMYSAALAFAPLGYAGGERYESLLEAFRQPISLGRWASELRSIIDDPSITQWPVNVLREVFRGKNGKPTSTARYLLDEFISIRNNDRGHGSQQPEGYYETLYRKNHLIIHDCIKASKHIDLPLLHIDSINHEGSRHAYRATMLMGATPTSHPESIVASSKVPINSTCVWDGGQQLLKVNPFVVYCFCSVCQQEHSFFVERITKDRLFYHSYSGNHRISVDRSE